MIRKYETSDLIQCARIFREAFSEENWGCVWTQERAELYLSDYANNPKFIGFVSENEGVIDGAIFGCKKVSWNNDEIHVDELIVDPKKQRSGIGTKLIDKLKEYSKEHGLAGIVLYTHEQAPAKRFYEKNGFQLSDGVICMYWVL
ncbi:MAG: GNAT family N-acetyltransferase [Ruminiclostridium sp.]